MSGHTSAAGGGIGVKLAGLLADDLRDLARALGERAVWAANDRVGGITERLAEYAARGGGPSQVAAATGAHKLAAGKSPVKALFGAGVAGGRETLKRALGKGGKGNTGKTKITNIVEFVDVGVPVTVAYNQWTRYEDFPRFMQKVENVERESDGKLNWKAQIFWSHRTWQSTIVQQVPDERIVWRSTGEKGSAGGAVSFHGLTPTLTRIMLVLEYRPQGLFERTGNLWRAQGRRARLELKHFVRHVMTQTVLHPDEVEGWRGEIRGGRVVRDHELLEEEPPQRAPRPRRPRAEPDQPRRPARRGAADEAARQSAVDDPTRRGAADEPARQSAVDDPTPRPARARRSETTTRRRA